MLPGRPIALIDVESASCAHDCFVEGAGCCLRCGQRVESARVDAELDCSVRKFECAFGVAEFFYRAGCKDPGEVVVCRSQIGVEFDCPAKLFDRPAVVALKKQQRTDS